MQNTNEENITLSNDVEATEKEEESLESLLSEENTDEKDKELERLREANKKLYERAKKAEAKAKVKPEVKAEAKDTQHIENKVETTNFITRDEAILLTQGLDVSDIDTLKLIAKAKNVPLVDAQKDELFVAFQEKRKLEREEQKRNLPSSKSSSTKSVKDISLMDREEHKDFVMKRLGIR